MNLLVRRPAQPEGHVTFGAPVVIDKLGAETTEQRTERKAQTPPMRPVDKAMTGVVLFVVGLVLLATGAYIGAVKPAIWEHVPGVPTDAPSGERAEPEHIPGPTLERKP